ncbi:hypothetical protein KDL29_13050 [bacterium]|nr:hypothetical protein [bacterium]MCB1220443.1 hypothetical protein [bacterium]UNM08144.1 MAG: hypothetical protein H7A35_15030 [Planctomycetales bacterium]
MQEKTFRLVVDLNDLSRLNAKIDLEEIGDGELDFELSARLVNPHGHILTGVLDVESPLPGSENKATRFEIQPGEWQFMGYWKLSSARDELIINADLEPRMPNGVVTFEFHAKPH